MTQIRFVDVLEVPDEIQEKLRQWRNREDIRNFMLNQHIISAEEHAVWLKGLRDKKENKSWVIFVKGKPIGSIYLNNINYEKSSSEWGFYIGDERYKGKGLAKLILFEFLEDFFEKMEFLTLYTRVFSDNTAALHIYRKFGFREAERISTDGIRKVAILEFSKPEWVSAKEAIRLYVDGTKLYLCQQFRPIYLVKIIFKNKKSLLYYQKVNRFSALIERYRAFFSGVFLNRMTIRLLPDDFMEDKAYLNLLASRRAWVNALYEIIGNIDKNIFRQKASLLNFLGGKLTAIRETLRLYLKHEFAYDMYDDLFLVEVGAGLIKNPQSKFYNKGLVLLIDKKSYWTKFVCEYATKRGVTFLSFGVFNLWKNKGLQFIFFTLRLFMEYITSGFCAKALRDSKVLNRIGVAYYGFNNFSDFFEKRNYYLFWYPQSGIQPQRIMIYSDGKMNISADEKKKIEVLGFGITSCGTLFRRRLHTFVASEGKYAVVDKHKSSFRSIKLYFGYLSTLFKLVMHIRGKEGFEQLKMLAVLFTRLAYWEDFFYSNNIKINFRFHDTFSYCDIAASLSGAATVTYNFTNQSVNILDITHNDICDIYFVWGKRYEKCFLNEHSDVKNIIHTGYIFDYTFDALSENGKKLREVFVKKGRDFIITILDESMASGMYRKGTLNLYRSLFEFLKENPDTGLIIKPKKNYTRYYLEKSPETSELFASLEKDGRIKVLDLLKYPVEAGKASDLVIGVSVGSAAPLECALAGVPTVIYDMEKMHTLFDVEGLNKIVFYDIQTMLGNIRAYKTNKSGLDGFADWSGFLDDKDSFKDGKANQRIGFYLKALLDGFDAGLVKETAIEKANAMYADKFSQDKIVISGKK